jgi:exopolysaccharide biosynthesis polyprenyl glycosylphosphotransferase
LSALPEQSAVVIRLGRARFVSRHRTRSRGEETRYVHQLEVADLLVAVAAGIGSYLLRFGFSRMAWMPFLLSALLPVLWLLLVGAMRAYEPRYLQVGSEEFRRVIEAGVGLSLTAAVAAYVLNVPLARGYLLALVLSVTSGTLVVRFVLRKRLHHRRKAGTGWMRRVVVAGHGDAVADIVRELGRTRWHGYEVVRACVAEPSRQVCDVPVTTGLENLVATVEQADADAVIVLPCRHIDSSDLRRLRWHLEQSDAQLLVAPGFVDVARQRTVISLVGSLPLVHIAHAELGGARRLVKAVFDRTAAALALLVVTPLLLLLMLAVRLDSRGPALFAQERVGRGDRRFAMLKLRTMTVDAESRRGELEALNEADGALFKIHEDPRVTRVGRVLRRYSLDELPQLVNVLLGEMSLVGPRPPLPVEVDAYPPDVHRRLVVKPGMTGLWQVSGRADLDWEEATRLDLQYVENWSLTLDLSILWKTGRAVLSRAGAY